MSNLNKIFDYWLPAKISEEFDKARLNLFIRVISVITWVGFLSSLFTIAFLTDQNSRIYYVGTTVLTAALYFIILYTVKKTGNLNLAYHIGGTLAVVFMTKLVFESGGIYSTSILSIWIILIASFFIASIRAGIVWSVITVLYIVLFYVLEVFEIDGFKPHMDSPSRRVMDLIFITTYISFVLIIYERNRKGLLDRMHKAHTELKKQNQSLIELNREKENLMAIVAHDLKSPQQQLLAILSLMEMEFKAKNIPTDYIKMGKNILNGSIHLINDITYSKEISDGFVIQHKEKVEVTPFVSDMIQSFESTAKEKNISIVPAISTNGLSIEIDKIIMGRILQNIISNAIKFSPFEKSIFITASNTNNQLIVSVKDEGPGIAKEEQQLLFKRFQKLSARPTNKESSSGLGLYIVKTLVDKIGGDIQVISDKGQGAEFKLVIPLKK